MIRYHKLDEDKFLVTARRKPRGFVVRAQTTERRMETPSRYEAYYTFLTKVEWRPVGFDGHEGPVFYTKQNAANRLVSDHRFGTNGHAIQYNGLYPSFCEFCGLYPQNWKRPCTEEERESWLQCSDFLGEMQ